MESEDFQVIKIRNLKESKKNKKMKLVMLVAVMFCLVGCAKRRGKC